MPIPFCSCHVCTLARSAGGKNLRRRSSIAINDDLLVDIGPDIGTASFEFDIPLTDIGICLQTHAHEDHFDPEWVMSRHSEYGTTVANDLLIVGSRETLETMDAIIGRRWDYGSIFDPETQAALCIKLMPMVPFETISIGQYQVTGYPANHGTDRGCLLYSIEQDDQTLFYGTDTSVLSEEVWDHLRRNRARFDLVILDQTYGIGLTSKPADHLASEDVVAHVDRFHQSALLKENARVYATHLSHEGCLEHHELDEYAQKHGYRMAFDGQRVVLDG